QADTRAELVGIDVLVHLVEPQPCVQGQVISDLPFVLKISAKQPAGLGTGIKHGGWCIDRTGGRVGWIGEPQYSGYVGDQRSFRADGKSKAQGMGVTDAPSGIFLDAIDKALT